MKGLKYFTTTNILIAIITDATEWVLFFFYISVHKLKTCKLEISQTKIKNLTKTINKDYRNIGFDLMYLVLETPKDFLESYLPNIDKNLL